MSMKKYWFLLLITLLGLEGTCQTPFAPTLDTVYAYGTASDFDILQNTYTSNLGSSDVTVNWERINVSLPNGWTVSNCFVNCFGPAVTTGQAVIQVGDSAYTNTHFYPNGIPGTGIVKLVLEEDGNPSNNTEVVFVCIAEPVGIQESSQNTSLHIYPNPSSQDINIANDSGLLQSISIYDMAGSLVGEYPIVGELIYIMNIRHLEKGLYLIKGQLKDERIVTSTFVKN